MKDSTRNFVLGITTIVAGLGLVVLLMLFGELDRIIRPRYEITIHTDDAAGVRSGSGVELNGVPIGTVDRISMIGDGDYPVTAVMLIDNHVRISQDVRPFATSSPLGGAATLQLERARPQLPVPGWIDTDGGGEITGTIRSRLLQEVTDTLDQFVSPLVTLAENLNTLLEIPDPTDPAAVRASIRTTVTHLNTSLMEVEALVTSLNEVFGAPDLSDPEAAAESVRTTIRNANAALEQYSNLARTLERDIGEIARGVGPAMASFETALNEVQLLASQARQGQGTIGQLLNNPDLYLSLVETMDLLDQLIAEAKILIEKMKAEGVRVDL